MQLTHGRTTLQAGASLRSLRLLESAARAALATERARAVRSGAPWEARAGAAYRADARRAMEGGPDAGAGPGILAEPGKYAEELTKKARKAESSSGKTGAVAVPAREGGRSSK